MAEHGSEVTKLYDLQSSIKEKINASTMRDTEFYDVAQPYDVLKKLNVRVTPQLEEIEFYDGGRIPDQDEYIPQNVAVRGKITKEREEKSKKRKETKVRQEIDLSQILNNFNKGQICFVGPAGSGKTTLLKAISRDVMEGKYKNLKDIEIVHFVKCTDFRATDKVTPAELLFRNVNPEFNKDEMNGSLEFAKRNPNKVLFVIDSLDTRPYTLDGEHDVIGLDEEASPATILWNLLTNKLIPGYRSITSSREHTIRKYEGDLRADKVIALVGLTEESMKQIIIGYLDEKEAEEIMSYLRSHHSLLSLCGTPVFLVFTLIGWKCDSDFTPSTMSGIMVLLLQSLLRSSHAHAENIEDVINKLKALAFTGTREGRVLFQTHELTHYKLDEKEVTDVAVLAPRGEKQRIIKGESILFFCHQSIQETLTAFHIAEMDLDEFKTFVAEDLHTPHYCVVRRFLCGIMLDKDVKNAAGQLLKASGELPEKKTLLLASLSEQVYKDQESADQLELFISLYEARDGMTEGVKITKINLRGIRLMLSDIHAVGSVIHHYIHLESVTLSNCNLPSGSLQVLASSLQGSNMKISSLNLSWNRLDATAMSCIGNIVKECQVDSLDLSDCNLSFEGLENFKSSVGESKISNLELGVNSFDAAAVTFILDIVQQCQVEEFSVKAKNDTNMKFSRKTPELLFRYAPLATMPMSDIGLFVKHCQVTSLELHKCDLSSKISKNFKLSVGDFKVKQLKISRTKCDVTTEEIGALIEILPCVTHRLVLKGWDATEKQKQKICQEINSRQLTELEIIGTSGPWNIHRSTEDRNVSKDTQDVSQLQPGNGSEPETDEEHQEHDTPFTKVKDSAVHDGEAKHDYLNRKLYAESLARVLHEVKTPFTLGIYGRFGSGKSSLISYLRDKIQEKEGVGEKEKKREEERISNDAVSDGDWNGKYKCSFALLLSALHAITSSVMILSPFHSCEQTSNLSSNSCDADRKLSSDCSSLTNLNGACYWLILCSIIVIASLIDPFKTWVTGPCKAWVINACKPGVICPFKTWVISPCETWVISPCKNWVISACKMWVIRVCRTWVISACRTWVISPCKNRVIGPCKTWVISPFKNRIISPCKTWVISPFKNRIISPCKTWIMVHCATLDICKFETWVELFSFFLLLFIYREVAHPLERYCSHENYIEYAQFQIQICKYLFCILELGLLCGIFSQVNLQTILLCSFAAFTHLPSSKFNNKKTQDQITESSKELDRRYIFVKFSCWDYAGSDNLWAGIIQTMLKKIEDKFGRNAIYVFRTLQLGEHVSDSMKDGLVGQMWHHAIETFFVPNWLWLIVSIVTFRYGVHFLIAVITEIDCNYHIFTLLWILSAAALFGPIFFRWLLSLYTRTSNIFTISSGDNESMSKNLGFMKIIKDEVETITKLTNCARLTHGYEYKIVLSLDDIDRLSKEMAAALIEAVYVLLSEPDSPFICILAVDSLLAALCVEQKKKLEGLSGHEYLKKIINLPFCIPRLHYKKVKMNYVHELLNQSTERGKKGKSGITKQRMSYEDLTARGLITQSRENIDEEQSVNSEVNVLPQDNRQTIPKVPAADESPGGSGITKERPNRSDLLMVPAKRDEDAENEQPGLSVKTTTIVRRTSVSDQPPASSKHTSINQEADFGVKCRKEMHSCAELLHDNPRNIKRIYNILTLAADIYIRRIKEFEEEKDANAPKLDEKWARYLTLWVMLAEQWPVATCYILHSNAEMHSNSNAENVLEIFRNVELAYIKDDNRKGVDGNQVSLGKFLQEMSEISSQKLKQLAYLTVVVNDSLYHEVEMKQSVDLNDTQIPVTVVNNTG